MDFDDLMTKRPKNYLFVNVLFLFLLNPLAAIGILYGIRVNKAWSQGLAAEAKSYSKSARLWAFISWGFECILFVILGEMSN